MNAGFVSLFFNDADVRYEAQTTPANAQAAPRKMHRATNLGGRVTSTLIVLEGLRLSSVIIKSV